MNRPIFNIDLLKYYQVIDRPGTFIVSVAYDVTDKNLYLKDDYPRYLIPLRVIRSADLPSIIKILKDGDVYFDTIKHKFLTGAIFDDNIDITTLPTKGEKVVATFEDKDDKLQCSHIKLIDRDNLMYVNFSVIDNLYNLAEKFLFKK